MAPKKEKKVLEVVTEEQYDEMVRGMATWERIKEHVQLVSYMQARAASQWNSGEDLDYLCDVTAKELTAVQISGDGDEGWDSTPVTLTREQVLNMQEVYDTAAVLVDFLAEQQQKKQEEYLVASRRKLYEELKGEFGSV